MSQAKNWCFTLNNYTNENIERLSTLIETNPKAKFLIYGKEVGENGTPHLQGFVQFSSRMRMNQVKEAIGSNPHVEIARNVNASIEYCKKEGDFYEYGVYAGGTQGRRNDLEDFKEAVKNGLFALQEIRELHSEVYMKYPRFCLEYVQDKQPEVVLPDHPLRPWQTRMVEKLEEEPDRRKIVFVVDETGNSGKTWFAHWYVKKIGDVGQVMLPAKKSDMAYALKQNIKVLFLDAPRSKQGEYIQYDFLEDLKNGYVFSPKYESRAKTFNPMHVVVLMNEQPDRNKLSADRYDVMTLSSL